MGRRHEISDADWDRIKDQLPGRPGQHGRVAADNRRFINAVLWVARTGSPGQDKGSGSLATSASGKR